MGTRTDPPFGAGELIHTLALPGWSAPLSRLQVLTLRAARRAAALEAYLRVLVDVP
jgi:hypothetical protein